MSSVTDHETRLVESDHHSLKLWLRLLTCSSLIEKKLRDELRLSFDMTLPRFDFLAQLERNFDPLYVRKTLLLKNISFQNGTRDNLFQSLDNAFFVCTYSSGIGIDSIIRGKPVVISSPASFVYDIRTKLEDALNFKFNKNDRIQILSNIAYCQWHIDEIELGLPWQHLTKNI